MFSYFIGNGGCNVERHHSKMTKMRKVFLVLFLFLLSHNSFGSVLALTRPLSEETLSESVPTAFAPGPFEIADFDLEWSGDQGSVKLDQGSLQWVRVNEILVLPRARLILDVENLESGQLSHSGFHQSIEVKAGHGHAEIPVALISGDKNPIAVTLVRAGKVTLSEIRIRFHPKGRAKNLTQKERIFFDSTCSPFQVSGQVSHPESHPESHNDNWMYVGCRQVRALKEDSQTSSLELFVFWDNVGQSISLDGVVTPSQPESVWQLRLRSDPGKVVLKSKDHEVTLTYHAAKILHNAFVGLGIGPHSFEFQGDGNQGSSIVPLVTLYSSYFITETIRFVGFGARTLNPRQFTNVGAYLYFESNRFFDRRGVINFLVGVHGLGFRAADEFYLVNTFPQGVELVYTDAFVRGKSLKLGAFVYPLIAGNSYYNLWLRWGGSIFGELHYFAARTQPTSTVYTAESFGVSVGFPLATFW